MDIKDMLNKGVSEAELRRMFEEQMAAAKAKIKDEEDVVIRAARRDLIKTVIVYLQKLNWMTTEEADAALGNFEEIEEKLIGLEKTIEKNMDTIKLMAKIAEVIDEEEDEDEVPEEADEIIRRFLKGL